MARYTLPSLLQGHPPSQSSGTLMSLQEGIAAAVRAWSCGKPFSSLSPLEGALTSHSGATAMHPNPNIPFPGELSAVPHPEYSPPRLRAHPSQAERPAVRSHTAPPHPLLHLPGEGERASRGEAGMFRRDIRVSEAERGRVPCRSKEHTASTRPTQAAS